MLKLASTSALVLLWAQQECYQSKSAKHYLSQLDLEEGKSLYNWCREVCPYYDEVIKNRKFGVFNLVKKYFSDQTKNQQLVIAAAGLDALGIEVVELYPHSQVFELDKENMDIKSRLTIVPENKTKRSITFIQANLLDFSEVYKNLIERGWDPQKPTLLVFEGISYYLSLESIQKFFHVLNPDFIVFEFLKQKKEIAADRVDIPEKIFGKISSTCGLPFIGRFSYEQLEKLFDPLSVKDKYSMNRLEKMRTRSNKFFPTDYSGWIEVCLLENEMKTVI
jgi:Leucine carboxyl methyltransferase